MNEALQVFLNTLATVGGVIAAIAVGIVAITLFFKVLGWFAGNDDVPVPFDVAGGELDDETIATVHLIGGRTFENVRVSGLNQGYGFDANQMLVLRDDDGTRYFVQHRHVRLIVAPATITSNDPDDDGP